MIQLINSDCFSFMSKMKAESINLILTDPPWKYYKSNRITNVEKKYREITTPLDPNWVHILCQESFRVLAPNSHCYIFTDFDAYPKFYYELKRAGFQIKKVLFWIKEKMTAGDLVGDYGERTEQIIFATKGRRELNGKRLDNLFPFNRVVRNEIWHPTQKPLELLQTLIKKSTNKDDLIFDCFGGVYSTALAASLCNRSCISVEINEEYHNKGKFRFVMKDLNFKEGEER